MTDTPVVLYISIVFIPAIWVVLLLIMKVLQDILNLLEDRL